VIATASGAAPARLVRKLGAHHVIDARSTESTDQLRTFAPDGLDCVLALAGGKELERCLDFLQAKGRLAHPNGIEPVPMERRTFRARAFDAVANPREFDKLNRHLVNGKIRVPIAASYPLRARQGISEPSGDPRCEADARRAERCHAAHGERDATTQPPKDGVSPLGPGAFRLRLHRSSSA
jgi:NADPH:quinone reductase-like Zn-dependent oxidoreductase